MRARHQIGERGQALAETALFAMLAVIMAFGLLAWIPTHRARTAATAALLCLFTVPVTIA
ncbi:hypothetical protein [Candidatus Villigracilis affinis]|uniref:hypothetical protein n=1 Tax=Candidatus Villigracilis affinis TaxID=3140682 RepID=UPI001DFAB3AA|nr:hypothetical protein [Anaerolineales bacterium]